MSKAPPNPLSPFPASPRPPTAKPPGYYVVRETGLFPAPYPQDHAKLDEVVEHFRVLGIFMAKALQDGRLVDMPLSRSFCKLLCGRELAWQDLCDISPTLGRTILALQNLANEKRVVDTEHDTKESRREAYKRLAVSWPGSSALKGHGRAVGWTSRLARRRLTSPCFVSLPDEKFRLEDLDLSMVYLPPSKQYGFAEHELRCVGPSVLLKRWMVCHVPTCRRPCRHSVL